MEIDDVLKKYSRKIEQEMNSSPSVKINDESMSQDYFKFKKDMMPELSRYERWAKGLGNIIKISVTKKDEEKLGKYLGSAHLNVTPSEVLGLAFMSFVIVFFFGIFSGIAFWYIGGGPGRTDFPILYVFLMSVTSFFLFYYFYTMPSRLATKWRLKASSQMVPAILYTVIYMKHTSNLERAISFVAQHIEAPLALDIKKVLWDVETGKYSSVKESLDYYLEFWKDTNMEFVESFHLVESSLYEPNEGRRIQILERALRIILDGVYERMLKYTHNIKAPLTNLYMLGIVLPTLGLALLPLASALLSGMLKSSHIFVMFNIIIPFLVFYMTLQIMLTRPGGYGETSLLENNPMYPKYVSRRPYYIAFFICLPFLIIGVLPFIFQIDYLTYNVNMNLSKDSQALVGLKSDYTFSELGIGLLGEEKFFGFEKEDGRTVGPFGVGALLLSLFIPFSIVLFFSLSYSSRTKELIKSRDQTKDLEQEFNSSLFTLGNRLGDGLPAEVAFVKIASSTKGQKTEQFFRVVNTNVQSMGMSLEEAIFNPKRGAMVYYPSSLIATSMRILIESVKKGLNVAAESLMSISEYVRNIQKINERLRDLLADVVSDMKSNMTFLAPLLAGIVIGLAAMITGIISRLEFLTEMGQGDLSVAGIANIGQITQLFRLAYMIPPYFMQIAIGIYIIQIIFILTGTLVTIDAGEDKLKETFEISRNLFRGGLLYLITALLSILALASLSGVALKGIGA
ncbi:MAG: hypothetical protein Q8N99_05555 [Nanoarchaeota archaeon]|nr:hypothetical protein [Nanoarchaeota archaeon]